MRRTPCGTPHGWILRDGHMPAEIVKAAKVDRLWTHGAAPADLTPAQWYVLTRCRCMATCPALPKIVNKMPTNAHEHALVQRCHGHTLTLARGLMPGVSPMPALPTARRPSDVWRSWPTPVSPNNTCT